jgi:PIN domain-containing protein
MMKDRCLLVDFENVQKIDLSKLAEDFHVTIFVGSAQKTVPFDLVQGAQRLGPRLEWLRVEGSGSNALDFHIAYYLGCHFTQFPKAQCFILSKDSGFDPLVRHLIKKGFRCQRINSLIELEPQQPAASEPNYKRLVELLTKTEKKLRPRKRTTLAQHVSAMFQKKLPEGEVERLIDLLFIEGKVSETGDTLSYTF